MKRYLCIDFGLKRLGIAISDENTSIALPITTLAAGKDSAASAKQIFSFIEKLEYSIEKIIIGYPLLLNGKKSDMTLLVEKFAEDLRSLLLTEVELFDERLSSKSIDTLLRDSGVKRKKRDEASDMQAASLLLQNYLDQKSRNGTH